MHIISVSTQTAGLIFMRTNGNGKWLMDCYDLSVLRIITMTNLLWDTFYQVEESIVQTILSQMICDEQKLFALPVPASSRPDLIRTCLNRFKDIYCIQNADL
jgi:hypothetical protein